MLVLNRKKNEGITIQHPAGNIHVTVVEIRGDKVRIGVEADKAVFVHRDEVFQAIQRDGTLDD
jgi:carbon storage regulator